MPNNVFVTKVSKSYYHRRYRFLVSAPQPLAQRSLSTLPPSITLAQEPITQLINGMMLDNSKRSDRAITQINTATSLLNHKHVPHQSPPRSCQLRLTLVSVKILSALQVTTQRLSLLSKDPLIPIFSRVRYRENSLSPTK